MINRRRIVIAIVGGLFVTSAVCADMSPVSQINNDQWLIRVNARNRYNIRKFQ